MAIPLRGRSCPAIPPLTRRGVLAAISALALPAPLARAASSPDFVPVAVPAAPQPLPVLVGASTAAQPVAGQVTLIHFFATWCASCQAELAALAGLHAAMAGRPFTLLAVDSGEPEARVRRYFEHHPMPFPVLLDESRAAMKAWDVITFPTSFLVAPGAAEALKLEGEANWADAALKTRIASLFKTNTASNNQQ